MHEDRRRAGSFGDDALRYDRARPSYPAALVDDLLTATPRRVLDIGCGTSIAGRLFLERGCDVLGVEPDPRMAEVARRHRVAVDVATFEEWQPPAEGFDLAISAQAWHWIDPRVGPRKAASILNAGGVLALFWNIGTPEHDIGAALDDTYQRVARTLRRSVALGTVQPDYADRATSIASSGAFETPEIRTYLWERQYSRDQWLDQLATHSDHRTLDPERLGRLLDAVGTTIDEFEGTMAVRYTTTLIVARLRG